MAAISPMSGAPTFDTEKKKETGRMCNSGRHAQLAGGVIMKLLHVVTS